MHISDVTPCVCRHFPYDCRTVVGTFAALSPLGSGARPVRESAQRSNRWGAQLDSFVGTRAPGVFIAAVAPLAFLAPRAFDAALHRTLSHGEDVRSLLQVVISASTLPLSARRGDTARACPAWHDPIVLLGVARPHCCARRGDTASMPRLDATTKAAQRSARATFASRGSAASCGAIMIGCRARARRSTARSHLRSSGVSKSN